LAQQLRDRCCAVEVVAGSVADPALATQTVGTIGDRFGRLDVLVNNAGVSPSFRRAEDVVDADWRAVLATNLLGPLNCSRAALPLLEISGSASIVNISSIHGARARAARGVFREQGRSRDAHALPCDRVGD
jgi:NAD(P)-dependent dehydrogenase (short-subunit alcohol dehydrogenase family)